jgi:hypothetical protein
MALEEPRYQVVQRFDDFEVREYATYLVAEIEVGGDRGGAGNQGFRRLAAYIFGKNRGEKKMAMAAPVAQAEGQKIAMAAPVAQVERRGAGDGRRWVIRFVMPSRYTPETLPEPLDPGIRFRWMPPSRFAALRYSGTWSESSYQQRLAELRRAMSREGLRPASEPVWARYNPPFVPWFLRRNEILIETGAEP